MRKNFYYECKNENVSKSLPPPSATSGGPPYGLNRLPMLRIELNKTISTMQISIIFDGMLAKDEAVIKSETGAQQLVTVLDNENGTILFVSASNKLVKAKINGDQLSDCKVLRERVHL